MNIDRLYDKLTGPCVRKINSNLLDKNSLFLTFDDGPHSSFTTMVLKVLEKHQAKATFFVIGNNVTKYRDLADSILKSGHAIGNHTIDHDTKNYFKNKEKLKKWVQTSEDHLKNQLSCEVVGFRSPLGIKTPSLMKALKEEQKPLVLWDTRFYDTNYELTKQGIDEALAKLKNGSIILLHDTQEASRQENFLTQLEYFITGAKKLGYTFLPLSEKLITDTYQEKYGFKK